MSNGIQTQVNQNPAPAVEGDFCDANPRYSIIAGPGALVAGLSAYVGRFCWLSSAQVDGDGAPAICNSFGSGLVDGFIGRNQQGLITRYLDAFSMQVAQGFGMFAYSAGGFWIRNSGVVPVVRNMKAYANFADGKATFAATGAPANGASVTASIAAGAGAVTASIDGDVMTVTAVGSGTVPVGATLSGSGVASGTKVLAQLTGTNEGIGTYRVSIEQTTASTAVTAAFGIMTVTAVGSGAIGVGDVLAGSGVDSGTFVTALRTGAGGTGTYIVNSATVVGSTTITAAINVETSWIARTPALPGELVKISNLPGIG
jgi:hypothetical protein